MQPIHSAGNSQIINGVDIKSAGNLDPNLIKVQDGEFAPDKIKDSHAVFNHVAPQKATLSKVGSQSLSLGEITAHKSLATQAAFNMKTQMEEALPAVQDAFENIDQINRDLANKDWSLSIDEKNDLVISSQQNHLTKDEVKLIKSELIERGVKNIMENMAKQLMDQLHHDRLGEAKISNNMGRYDVTRENLPDIINFKQAFQASENTGQSAGQSAQQVMDNIYSKIQQNADDKYSQANQTILIYQP